MRYGLLLTLFLLPTWCVAQTTRVIYPNTPDPNQPGIPITGMLTKSLFTTDGQYLLTVDSQNMLKVWNTQTWKTTGELSLGQPNTLFRWQIFELSGGKQVYIVGSAGKAYTINIADGKLATKHDMPIDFPCSYALAKDGKTLLKLKASGELITYDVSTGKENEVSKTSYKEVIGELERSKVALAPDAATFAINSYTGPRLVDIATKKILFELKTDRNAILNYISGPYDPIYSADSRYVVFQVADGSLRVVQTDNGQEVRKFGQEVLTQLMMARTRNLAPVALSSNGRLLLLSTDSHGTEMLVMGVQSGLELRRLPGNVIGPNNNGVSFSPDSRYVVISGQRFNVAVVWNLADNQPTETTPAKK